MIPIEQELVREIDLPEFATKAFLVIDKTVWNSSWGGLRVIPDPSMDETMAAARTMSLKYGFIGLPIGGAKAALGLPAELEPERTTILKKLGEAIAPILRTHRWSPGLDMGSSIADLKQLFLGAEMDVDFSTWRNQSATYTAWSVFISTQAAVAARGRTLQGMTFVIQGLGRVGTKLAGLLADSGAHLLGFSTQSGACFNKNGIDVAETIHLRERAGEESPLQFPSGTQLESSLLFEQDVDIAVPCARAWAVSETNWKNIRATILPCAANAAIDVETEKKLHKAGKTVIPDFIANCGGVFGSYVDRYLQPADIRAILESNYRQKVERLLARSAREATCLSEIAAGESLTRINHAEATASRMQHEIARRILPVVPDPIRRPLLRDYCRRTYFTDVP